VARVTYLIFIDISDIEFNDVYYVNKQTRKVLLMRNKEVNLKNGEK